MGRSREAKGTGARQFLTKGGEGACSIKIILLTSDTAGPFYFEVDPTVESSPKAAK